MRYRLECHDRNGGEPYTIEQEGRSPEAAMSLAMMSGHAAVRVLDDVPPTPRRGEGRGGVGEHPAVPSAPRAPLAPTPGLGVTGFILVCLGLVLSCIPFVALPLAAVGVVVAAISRPHTGLRSAAIVVGAVAMVFAAVAVVGWILLVP